MTEFEGKTGYFFDRRRLWPYDCAPMLPDPIPQQLELRKLAALGTEIAGDIPLLKVPRFCSMLVEDSGVVTIELELGLGENCRPIMTGQIRASVQVECQRCLQPMNLVLKVDVKLVFVWSETEFPAITENRDPLVLGDERLELYDLVEEELLLALPYINCHDQKDCSIESYAAGSADEVLEQEPGKSPFDVLRQIKREDQEN